VHAEADFMPGVVIDRFGTVAVIQPNAAWAETHIHDLAEALEAVTGITTIIKNGAGAPRAI
jgi:23S rRNA (cytosine1962-C5)-methyltransferase